MSFPNTVYASEGQQYLNSATKGMPYGQKMELEDGRVFRYTLVGTTATVVGSCYQAIAADAQFDDAAVQTAGSIGDTTIYLTNGTTTLAKDELEDGYVLFYTAGTPSTLLGCYPIESNVVEATGSATYNVTLRGDEGLVTAIATTDKYSVLRNLWYKTVLFNVSAAPTARLAGFAVRIITAAYYGFLQTRGICEVLVDDGAALDPGDTCTWPSGLSATSGDGFADNSVTSNDGDVEDIGINCNIASVDDGAFVYLKLE